ncbi:TRAP transporter small permease [Peteryoungia ipomoeae]|uniref:TRAP transporter small permease protein n=1 Tax=Peteryoungia ipomoeae TaxID=1210932 RepID=A0A4S8NSA1_9HYPH|nr:TRAP transporter small permease [Peteryoungia ipomoeae]THV20247.1 TRAP transporter small permease [Peteryoungia ipomoeae]
MSKIVDLFYRFLEWLLILLLSGMAIMVFVNVILRYAMNSGLTVSDEMARYFFVWLTFIGAVVGFREYGHLGVESLVAILGRRGRVVCMILTNLIILGVSLLFFWGTWKQLPINASMAAPVTGLSMGWVYGIGFFAGGGCALIALERLIRLVTGRVTEEEIAAFAGENLSIEKLSERA